MSLGHYLIISIFLILGGIASLSVSQKHAFKVFGGLCTGSTGIILAIASMSYFRQAINGFIVALFLFFGMCAVAIAYTAFFLKLRQDFTSEEEGRHD